MREKKNTAVGGTLGYQELGRGVCRSVFVGLRLPIGTGSNLVVLRRLPGGNQAEEKEKLYFRTIARSSATNFVTNLPNSWVLDRSGGDLAARYMSPSDLTREVFDEGSDLPWEAGGLRILCPVRVVSLPGVFA